MKKSRIIILTSFIITLSVAALTLIVFPVTGFYPGMVVLISLTLIPIASFFYARRINTRSDVFQGNIYATLSIVNLLVIFVVLWMSFVITIDRVIPNI
jgi:hypothetical protein